MTKIARLVSLVVLVAGLAAWNTEPAPVEAAGRATRSRVEVRPTIRAEAKRQVWFAPLQNEPPQELSHGSVDYFDLFRRNAPWKRAAARVDVFKIYGGWILNSVTATDARIRTVVMDLERRGIGTAFEVGPLDPTDECGLDVEGFSNGPTNGPLVIDRIESVGGSVEYIAMDEPFYYASLYDGRQACGWSATKVAKEVNQFLKAVRRVAPDVVVGDIEPLTSLDDVAAYKRWIETFARVTGHELPFFHVDADWYMLGWPEAVAELERFTRARGIDFGMIYDGGGAPPLTDRTWAERAEARMAVYEVDRTTRMDHVVFQSWSDLPDRVLPETQPYTFTWLIDRYFRTRTDLDLSVSPSGTSVSGHLTTQAGSPIPGAQITLTAKPTSGPGAFAEYTLTGTVPPGAVQGIAAFRANLECGCASGVDLTLYEARYTQGAETVNRVPNGRFDDGLDGWGVWGDGTIALAPSDQGGVNMLNVAATPLQSAAANSAGFPVTPGATFTMTFGARVSPSSEGGGYFAVVFLSADQEVGRPIIVFAPVTTPLGSATTDAQGGFELALPALGSGSFRIEARYAGNDRFWPAYTRAQAS